MKIDADRLLIDTRKPEEDENGKVVYGSEVLWEETEALTSR